MWNAAVSKAIWSVLCVFLCVCVWCVCVYVCLSRYPTVIFHFHTLRSFSSDEAASRSGTIRPASWSLISPFHCQLDSIYVFDFDSREETRTQSDKIPLSIQRLSMSTEDFGSLVFLFFFFYFCLLSWTRQMWRFAGQDAGPFAFLPRCGQQALLMGGRVKREKNNLCHWSLQRGAPPRGGGQNTNVSTGTQMHEQEVKNKGNSELNEHALVTQKCFHQTPFQTCFCVSHSPTPTPPHSTSDAASQHQWIWQSREKVFI